MRSAALVLMAAAALAAPKKPPKPVAELIERIEGAAAAETVVASIDTRLRAADTLKRFYPQEALRFATDAARLLAQVRNRARAAELGYRAVEILAVIDLEEAERALAMMPPGPPDAPRGREMAYALVTAYWLEKGTHAGREFIHRALGRGVYCPMAAQLVLSNLLKEDPPEAQALFARLLTAFPRDTAGLPAASATIAVAIQFASVSPALAAEAASTVLNAFPKPATSGPEEALLFQIAALLKVVSPELFERHQDRLGKWQAELEGFTAENVWKARMPRATGMLLAPGEPPPSAREERDSRPFDQALEAARGVAELERRVPLLVALAERPDAAEARRAGVAAEALQRALRLKPGPSQYRALARLLKVFSIRRDLVHAVAAAQGMTALLAEICRCDEQDCAEKSRWAGVHSYQTIVEQLRWEGVTLEALGLEDPSLRARYLVTDLDYLLHRPKQEPVQ